MTRALPAIAIAVLEVAGLLGAVVAAHRARGRVGPAPFLMVLGALQFTLYGLAYAHARIDVGGLTLGLSSTVVFPCILAGVLIAYVCEGTSEARVTMLVLVGLALLFPAIQAAIGAQIPAPPAGEPDTLVRPLFVPSLRLQLASAAALLADLVAIVVLFQALANRAARVPLVVRTTATLAVALALDAAVFTTITFAGGPEFKSELLSQLLVRPVVALLVGPAVALYLGAYASKLTSGERRSAFSILSLRVGSLEESLRRAEEESHVLRRVFQLAPEGMLLLDGGGAVLDANAAAARMAGLPLEELRRARFAELLRGWSRGGPQAGTPADGEDLAGVAREVEVRGAAMLVRVLPLEGRPGGAGAARRLVLLIDDSERRALESSLLHSQKMQALGTLAGGIAHDFNNLLLAILGPASILERRLPPDGQEVKLARLIATSAGRARELTRRLLTLSHRGPLAVKPVDVNAIVRETVELLKRSIEKRIEIRVSLSPKAGLIEADATQIQQAILNVCLNARDAIAGAGAIEVETLALEADRALAARTPGLEAGRYAVVRVADTGAGMTPEVLARIFEPFFTTKPAGQGTGLGLSMTYGIVRNHGGAIDVASEPGRGTTLRLFFPVLRRPSGEDAPVVGSGSERSRLATPPRGQERETVLVVDDEPLIRELASKMLEDLSYHVVTAGSGPEAVALYRERARQVALVILDLDLPGMSGAEIAAALRRESEGVRILVTSGFGASYAKGAGALAGTRFLEKPFRFEELAAAVRAVIEAPAPGDEAAAGQGAGGEGPWAKAKSGSSGERDAAF